MIVEVTETVYRGFLCQCVQNTGWKIVLEYEEYIFPTFVDAKFAIDRMHEDIIHKYGGKKYRKTKIKNT